MRSFLERVRKEPFPFFYSSGRVDTLVLVIAFSVMWAITGFDGTINLPILGGAYGVGLHWSTIQTFSVFFYVLTVNMYVGGLRSLGQLWREFVKDVRNLRNIAHPERYEGQYRDHSDLGPSRAFGFVLCVSLGALFFFEAVYVPLYDFFQFGSWFWPVYMAVDPTGNPLLSEMFLRNTIAVVVFFFAAFGFLYLVWELPDGTWSGRRRRFSVSWRFDRWFALIVAGTVSIWLLWIWFPHTPVALAAGQVISQRPFNETFFASQSWIFPTQGLFPQTDYTFYQASSYLKPYGLSSIYGFYVGNDWLHLVNVTAKYCMFLLVSYPALVRVKKNEASEV